MEHETQHCFLAWFAESRNIGALEIAEELDDDAEAAPGWSWREILSTKRSSCIHAVYLKSCGRSKATILLWISNKCQGWHVSHIQISSLRSSQTCCWYLNLSLPAFCHAANWFCSPDILRCLCAVASCQYHNPYIVGRSCRHQSFGKCVWDCSVKDNLIVRWVLWPIVR